MMNNERLQRLIAELEKARLPWQTDWRYGRPSQPTLKWIPVATLEQARIQLGLTSEGVWVRIAEAAVTEYDASKPCVFLLPVLEVGLEEARRSLEQGLHATGLSADFVDVFPFEDVVGTGLESSSERWTGLALAWAEQMPSSPRLQSALQTLRRSGPTQKLRHAAQKLVARQSR